MDRRHFRTPHVHVFLLPRLHRLPHPHHNVSDACNTTIFLLLFCLLSPLHLLCHSEARIQSFSSLKARLKSPHRHPHHTTTPPPAQPLHIFQVTKPIQTPPLVTPCSLLLLNHSFASTFALPPYIAPYHPSPDCGADWQKVILKWRATCKGQQFDRISAVWLSGVEIFRTCTAEPIKHGILWEVEKDVTRFAAVFKDQQSLVVSLGNKVNKNFTGVFHVTLTVDFYAKDDQDSDDPSSGRADMVLPVAMASPLNGSYWFQLQGADDVRSVPVKLPSNAYKAVLEICVSFHGDDEFWYTNPSNDYIAVNNLTEQPGNGPFREVVASIDDHIAGVVWPFPVVYTGGFNPHFWRPVAAIAAFDLPTYDFDITPFLGILGDGETHNITLTVHNSLPFWLLDANLHLWLDPAIADVKAQLLEYEAPALRFSSENSFSGFNGNLSTETFRTVHYTGCIFSSFGNITSSSSHAYKFRNRQIYSEDANNTLVYQNILTRSTVSSKIGSTILNQNEDKRSYPLTLFFLQTNLPNDTIIVNVSLSHAFNVQIKASVKGSSSSLKNVQAVHRSIAISNNNETSGWGGLTQNYSFKSAGECYDRSLSTKNYTILSDHVVESCTS